MHSLTRPMGSAARLWTGPAGQCIHGRDW